MSAPAYGITAALDYWHMRMASLSRRITADDAEPLPLPEWARDTVLGTIEWRTGRLAALASIEHADGITLSADRIVAETDAAAADYDAALALAAAHASQPAHQLRHGPHAQWWGLPCDIAECPW